MQEQKEITSIRDLNSTNVDKLNLSIRIISNGLNFDISTKENDDIIISDSITRKNTNASISDIIEEIFFENTWLSLPFNKVIVLYEPINWILIPFDLYEEENAHFWIRSITNYQTDIQGKLPKVVSHQMYEDGKVMVCDIEHSLFEFLSRSLIIQELKPYFVEELKKIRHISSNNNCNVLQISIRDNAIDLLIVKNGVIEKGNIFPFTSPRETNSIIDEIVYFTINFFNLSSLSFSNDRIAVIFKNINSKALDKQEVVSRLKSYSENIDIIE